MASAHSTPTFREGGHHLEQPQLSFPEGGYDYRRISVATFREGDPYFRQPHFTFPEGEQRSL
jgi:hypothetical protein